MTPSGLRRHQRFDYRQVLDFVYQYSADLPHVIDQPYRLTSYSLEDPRNFAAWTDEAGELMAFGLMQEPFAEFDYAVRPNLDGTGLTAEVLRWGMRRAQALANAAHLPFRYYLWETPRTSETLRQLTPPLARSERVMVVARLALSPARIRPPSWPAGFSLHVLSDADHVEYVALQQAAFGTRKMTPGWRARMAQTPQYRPDLNIAAIDSAGNLAAASIGWLGPGHTGQLEPGVTHPRYRRIGLMQAILQELFNRMQVLGVQELRVSWIGSNVPVWPLLSGLGFEPQAEYCAYVCQRQPRTLRGLLRALRARQRYR